MMLYPPMKNLLTRIPSRYQLVNVVASRARQISKVSKEAGISLEEKPVSIAIKEVADGMLSAPELQEELQEEVPETPEEENIGEDAMIA